MNNNNKNNNNNYVCSVRAFGQKLWLSEMAATFFMNNLTVEEVFEAYYECRKTKRYSYGALSFEANYEENLVELYSELKNQTWKPGKSTCFIVNQPVKREIFAAPFRDRIVHHILIRRLNPYFEKYFINDSYACREGKGTHAAIERAAHFVRSVSKNNTQSAYVLKLDIKGFFMSINQKLLYEKLEAFIIKVTEKNPEMDRNFLLYLGCFIKPEFITINKRVKNNFTEKLKVFWMLCEVSKPTKELKEEIRASLNSYLGIMLHYKTWLFKSRQIKRCFSSYLKNHFSVEYSCRKISLM